jgi:hypothetical protein
MRRQCTLEVVVHVGEPVGTEETEDGHDLDATGHTVGSDELVRIERLLQLGGQLVGPDGGGGKGVVDAEDRSGQKGDPVVVVTGLGEQHPEPLEVLDPVVGPVRCCLECQFELDAKVAVHGVEVGAHVP